MTAQRETKRHKQLAFSELMTKRLDDGHRREKPALDTPQGSMGAMS